ncbi:MAG: exosome protein [Desulfurococcales archaeon]|nr:exosome protein [Desulfurococcales archaeon]
MIRINRVELLTYGHATEDESKVLKAILNLLPRDLAKRVNTVKQIVKGHYGNLITIYRIVLRGRDSIAFLEYLATRLSDTEKNILKLSFPLRYNGHAKKLYLRFDKQQLFLGKIVLSDGDDVVKVVISFSGRGSRGDVLEILRKYGVVK